MGNRIVLRYTTHLINWHRHNKGSNEVINYTVNLAFLRLQPNRTKIQKIQQGTKNEGRMTPTEIDKIWLCESVGKLKGVGKKGEMKIHEINIHAIDDLQTYF